MHHILLLFSAAPSGFDCEQNIASTKRILWKTSCLLSSVPLHREHSFILEFSWPFKHFSFMFDFITFKTICSSCPSISNPSSTELSGMTHVINSSTMHSHACISLSHGPYSIPLWLHSFESSFLLISLILNCDMCIYQMLTSSSVTLLPFKLRSNQCTLIFTMIVQVCISCSAEHPSFLWCSGSWLCHCFILIKLILHLSILYFPLHPHFS